MDKTRVFSMVTEQFTEGMKSSFLLTVLEGQDRRGTAPAAVPTMGLIHFGPELHPLETQPMRRPDDLISDPSGS